MMLVLAGAVATAQEEPVKITEIVENLYLLSTNQGTYTTNTIAFVGEDGVLLVDTQSEDDGAELKKAVDAFGKGKPKYIINTHRHVEHVGGNAVFGDGPVVIAHDLVPDKLKSGSYLFNEFPEATFPDVTLDESLTLYFNGERIRIHALPGSHDDNEIIVHFTESKVVHLSSLVNGFNFPSVDSDGDVLRFAELVAKAIEMLPQDVIIVSGHNAPGTWQDLHAYHEMLVDTAGIVLAGLEAGKDLATLQEEKVLDRWETYAGSYVSVDKWTEYLVKGIQKETDHRTSVFELIYHAWKDKGAEAAVEGYLKLKRDHSDEYRIPEDTLFIIGHKLLGKEKTSAAVVFLEASLKDNPDSAYGYYINYELADGYNRLGMREKALRFCRDALELNPDFEAASDLLAAIKKE
jgi:glyoxylase-like metal-dependent hydrolase (beta-lactamase superfamily II)